MVFLKSSNSSNYRYILEEIHLSKFTKPIEICENTDAICNIVIK